VAFVGLPAVTPLDDLPALIDGPELAGGPSQHDTDGLFRPGFDGDIETWEKI
jgi:hypothetical protein